MSCMAGYPWHINNNDKCKICFFICWVHDPVFSGNLLGHRKRWHELWHNITWRFSLASPSDYAGCGYYTVLSSCHISRPCHSWWVIILLFYWVNLLWTCQFLQFYWSIWNLPIVLIIMHYCILNLALNCTRQWCLFWYLISRSHF